MIRFTHVKPGTLLWERNEIFFFRTDNDPHATENIQVARIRTDGVYVVLLMTFMPS